MKDKKDSLLVKKIVEQTQSFDGELTIENIIIDGIKYKLNVCNLTDSLHLEFKDKNGEGYRLLIDEKGIRFAKEVYDGGDCDSIGGIVYKDLVVKIEGRNKGETYWTERFPSKDEEDFFRVEFVDKKK
jgi:hypothetical protein